ncbi:MAG: nucleotide exchange factor GrpE [Parcubacteria group bacterium]|nr:nucleotide exchange factor GrpE [Parcubacteria group bacterium]MCR4342981.1 nucleotide exchange factor GrpE [Patescibacteria group bacterium]
MEKDEKNNNIDDDIIAQDESSSSSDIAKELNLKLSQCEKERQEYLEGWQRAKADFINFKKEEIDNRKKMEAIFKEAVLVDFLTVTDNFEMAFANKDAWEGLPKGWRQGIEHIYAQLISVLESHGLDIIESDGKKFNPEEHRAIGSIDVDSEEKDHIILEELQRGYRLGGKVVRPSQVKIGIYKKVN